jgi:hypothetical protein
VTRVVYVGGVIRSGSTLLDRLLGELPDYVSVGELCYIWDHSVRLDHTCGCGEAFSQCPFWTAVGDAAFGGWGSIDAEEVFALQQSVDSSRAIPTVIAARPSSNLAARVERYAGLLSRLYGGIAEVAGARVVVDSSKHAGPAYLLRRVPEVDLRVVHIVRDPRGVTNSLRKKVKRPETGAFQQYLSTWPTRSVARGWMTTNMLFSSMRAFGVPVRRLRYEDLVVDPRGEVTRIVEALDRPLPPGALDFIGDGAADLPTAHTLDGNPMRFSTGSVQLRTDEAWRTDLPPRDRRLVELSTWPLRRAYGYRD